MIGELRVLVDARITSGKVGGVETVLTGLASGMSSLDGPERITFLTWDDQKQWLEPYVSGHVTLVTQPRAATRAGVAARSRAAVAPFVPSFVRGWYRRRERDAWYSRSPGKDPFVENLRPQVIHIPIQNGFLTDVPSIYHPHDLQHRHLPEFFSAEEVAWRDRWYETLCRHSTVVAVSSAWTRADVIEQLNLRSGKVHVVPLAPPIAAGPLPDPRQQSALLAELGVAEPYALYPAQFWAHKNHIRLLQAIAQLRTAGLEVNLVGTGFQTEHFAVVDATARKLGIADLVQWPGFVPQASLRALFGNARAVIVPSLFESASGPLWEAFDAGVPAACSNVTSLPDQAGDAAVVFDPLSISSIADALSSIWTDDALRDRLRIAGKRRIASLSWPKTASIFRAHYRKLARATLSDEDRSLLSENE